VKDPIKFKTHELAERLGMTVAELRRRMSLSEMIDWIGYDRYKSALEDQAQEQVRMERKPKARASKARER
jgi:transcription initiation factor TFIIIB Brf1 subunit/transcription initiation factor TFIIB